MRRIRYLVFLLTAFLWMAIAGIPAAADAPSLPENEQALALVRSQQQRARIRIKAFENLLSKPIPPPEVPKGEESEFLQYDRLRGALLTSLAEQEQSRKTFSETERVLSKEAGGLETLRREERRRSDAEGGKTVPDSETKPLRQRIRLAEERIAQHEIEKKALLLQTRYLGAVCDGIRKVLEQLKETVKFSEAELAQEFLALEGERDRLSRDLQAREQQRLQAEEKLEALPPVSANEQPAMIEQRISHELDRDLAEQRASLLTDRLNRLSRLHDLWTVRYQVFHHQASREQLAGWAASTNQLLSELEHDSQRVGLKTVAIRREFLQLKDRAEAYSSAPELNQWLWAQRGSLDAMVAALDDDVLSIDADQLFARKLISEIEEQITASSWRDTLSSAVSTLRKIWSYELLTTPDDRPITVKKICVLIVFLVLAVFFSRRLSHSLGEVFLPRFGVSAGAAAALESLSYYALIVCFTLLGLHFANVPLTLFTVLGGAFAIGVGFGSQTIMNNFISGLIILVEQPVRPGDLIELDGHRGKIRRIGARSTILHTSQNVDIVVPNSEFLQKSLTNWTLSEPQVKISVEVGVAYNTDLTRAENVLLSIAQESPEILKTPPPEVIIKSIADSAIVLELDVMVFMEGFFNVERIQSALRKRIIEKFRTEGISIPFPQREVHFLRKSSS